MPGQMTFDQTKGNFAPNLSNGQRRQRASTAQYSTAHYLTLCSGDPPPPPPPPPTHTHTHQTKGNFAPNLSNGQRRQRASTAQYSTAHYLTLCSGDPPPHTHIKPPSPAKEYFIHGKHTWVRESSLAHNNYSGFHTGYFEKDGKAI